MIQSQILNVRDLIFDDNEVMDHLNCGICQELAMDARECDICENLFCFKCIQDWMQKNEQCPYRCSQQKINIKAPHKLVKNQINSIKFKCPNFSKGCDQQLQLENFENHLQKCEYKIIKCRFEGCEYQGEQKKIIDHESQCNLKVDFCVNCEFEYLALQGNHNCIKMLKEKYELLKQQTDRTIKILNEKNLELEVKLNLKLSKQYCTNGHELQWIIHKREQCFECKFSNELCRYYCPTCKQIFCQKCKKPKFQDTQCPINHILELQRNPPRGLRCDFCRLFIQEKIDTCYSDRECDFDICSTCFNQMNQQIY